MSYLKDFRKRIKKNNYYEFLKLWEEYCHCEKPDAEELINILKETKDSLLSNAFSQHVDRAISLWKLLEEGDKKDLVLKLILDIQNKNSDELADIAFDYLKKKYSQDEYFSEKIRLIGLRSRSDFQGAISKFELLNHLDKGKFVFHTAGWGTGEILDLSLIREDMTLEFEYVVGKRHIPFEKAINTFIPLSDDHFLARRFGDPDALEELAKKDPLAVIKMLLRDLGPKSAAEIKEELCDLVIPEAEWSKWWQSARNKIKKSTMIDSPRGMHNPFKLREEELSHEESLYLALESKPDVDRTIQLVYSFMKDFPATLKNREFRENLQEKLKALLECFDIDDSKKVEVLFLLKSISDDKVFEGEIFDIVAKIEDFDKFFEGIDIIAFRKRVLSIIRDKREDWQKIFLEQLFSIRQSALKDFILQSLEKLKDRENLQKKLEELLRDPCKYPSVFFWYFQKIISGEKHFLSEKVNKFFEGFMILLDDLYYRPQYKELSKKMVSKLLFDRYKMVRDFMEKASIDEVQEFLLLTTKCNILSDHEKKIVHSLGEVVYPELKKIRKRESALEDVVWTTKEGFERVQNKLKRLATVDTVNNSKEIEEARALGDLRENAEYKAALERRDRIQAEMKMLSDQLNKARILTKEDVDIKKAGVGTVIACEKKDGKREVFTILGPWDADPEKNIISFQSNLAKDMAHLGVGDNFFIRDEELKIKEITSFFA